MKKLTQIALAVAAAATCLHAKAAVDFQLTSNTPNSWFFQQGVLPTGQSAYNFLFDPAGDASASYTASINTSYFGVPTAVNSQPFFYLDGQSVFGANGGPNYGIYSGVISGAAHVITIVPYNYDANQLQFAGVNVGVSLVQAPVPEPETYALMLGGLGLVGAMARRKQRAIA